MSYVFLLVIVLGFNLCGYTSTRVVQKLIETLKTRQQISRVTLTLEPGFLDLIKDLNGNHVIQRCLQCLGKEDNRVNVFFLLDIVITRLFLPRFVYMHWAILHYFFLLFLWYSNFLFLNYISL